MILLIVVILLLMFYIGTQYQLVDVYNIELAKGRARNQAAREGLDEDLVLQKLSDRFRMVAQVVKPAVVHINTARDVRGVSKSNDPHPRLRGQGSGVIVDAEGYIVTNFHVIRGASTIEVVLHHGQKLEAVVVGADELTDLAVLKIPGDGLTALEWGDSDLLDDGSLVWSVGSPFGLKHSVTFGIISAKGRPGVMNGAYNPYQEYLQHDAAVNPGNSGGPLINVHGKLVGINTSIVSKNGGYQGISFALPSSIAKDVYEQIKSNRKVSRGLLGVLPKDISVEMAKSLKLENTRGALVAAVPSDGPAGKVGIRVNDVIIRWDGKAIVDSVALRRISGHTKPGTKVEVVVIRGGGELTFEVIIAERPSPVVTPSGLRAVMPK